VKRPHKLALAYRSKGLKLGDFFRPGWEIHLAQTSSDSSAGDQSNFHAAIAQLGDLASELADSFAVRPATLVAYRASANLDHNSPSLGQNILSNRSSGHFIFGKVISEKKLSVVSYQLSVKAKKSEPRMTRG